MDFSNGTHPGGNLYTVATDASQLQDGLLF